MNTLSVLLPTQSSTLFFFTTAAQISFSSSFLHQHQALFRTLGFCFPKSLHSPAPTSLNLRAAYKSSEGPFVSVESEISDVEEDEDVDDDDDDDEEAADEYDVISGDIEPDESDYEDEEEEEEEGVSGDGIEGGWSEGVESRYQRVQNLLKQVREFGRQIIDVNKLSYIYDFRIDKFQRLSMEAFLRGSSVVVSAPTSSGKTLIAEAAAVATFAKGRRLFYTTPLKALSNQKFREFCETFGENNVGLVTGDSVINKDAHVLIMTTEILRNMLYQSIGMTSSGGGLSHVDVIVLDEVHYLSDISRGTVWEEIVIYCPKEVQLICLSATVANPDELAGWIGQIHGKTELVTSSKRPVPLTWHFSTKATLLPLLEGKGKGQRMNRKLSLNYMQLNRSRVKHYKDDWPRRRSSRRRGTDLSYGNSGTTSELSKNNMHSIRRSQIPQVVDTLRQIQDKNMLPAIWFIFSRQGCDTAVQYLEDCELLDEREMGEVNFALERFRLQYPDAVRETAVKGLLRGAAAHHAGCLPLWKSFIEDLFQQGLVKVVFATETLAAGINMPARTAVIASLSKRSDNGRRNLNPNELLQMAGRAGRRGIDTEGHVVLIQALHGGAEESCKVLFAGVEPLVSQFTASYGMVLNLLAGAKVTSGSNDADDDLKQAGRTLEEARKLVEQSFGNYVGSNVMIAAKEELIKTKKDIEFLTLEISDEAIDKKIKKLLSPMAYKEFADLQEKLRAEKRLRTELREKTILTRTSSLKPLLEESEKGDLPFLSLQYKDSDQTQHVVSAVYLGKVVSLGDSKLKTLVATDDSFALNTQEEPDTEISQTSEPVEPSYHVALGSDNDWYLFTDKWIRTVYRRGLPNVALADGGPLPRERMIMLLDKELQWEKLSVSELGGLWHMEGSLETWSWSLNVPVLSSLSETDELQFSQPYLDALEMYKDQRNTVSHLKKKISRTEGFKGYKSIIVAAKLNEEKLARLQARAIRLTKRIEQIEPSGWKEFLQISNVILETRALDTKTHVIFPLGETAAAIRGENELWLAMVLQNKILLELKPPQLAAVCGSIVSEGIKVRPWKNNNFIYEATETVLNTISCLEEERISFMELQEKHEVNIPCCLDSQFAGMVEAWASGLTWRELMTDCAMDEGDVARLMRRTIDLLAQIPKLPDIDRLVQQNAMAAHTVMDRPPISELTG